VSCKKLLDVPLRNAKNRNFLLQIKPKKYVCHIVKMRYSLTSEIIR